jgi:ribonuclease HII
MRPKKPPTPDLHFETHFFKHGIQSVAGIDEAGRGAWAGPVVAAAVVLPPPSAKLKKELLGLHDSKKLTPSRRETWDDHIRKIAVAVSVGRASVQEIDLCGILPATRLAMRRALESLPIQVSHLLVDYILIGDVPWDQTAIPHGDARSLSIAAASVIAKVARDRLMVELDRHYAGFGFARHKGYGTTQHQRALQELGTTAAHRTSFEPIRREVEKRLQPGQVS